jgi:hypothetical protein
MCLPWYSWSQSAWGPTNLLLRGYKVAVKVPILLHLGYFHNVGLGHVDNLPLPLLSLDWQKYMVPHFISYRCDTAAALVHNLVPTGEDIWDMRGQLDTFLSFALDGNQWQASCTCCFSPQYPLDIELGEPQRLSGHSAKQQLSLSKIKPQPFQPKS